MVYAHPPTTFEQMIAPFPTEVQATAKQLRELIYEVLPQLDEKIYGGKKVANALYHFADPRQVLCGIQANDNVCKLFLHHFEHVDGMGYPIEGSGKNARHIKLATPDEIKRETLTAILNKVWLAAGY